MNEAERLEALEDLVLRARDAAVGCAVVVEGLRDLHALEALGIGGVHVAVNQGRPLEEVVDRLAEDAAAQAWGQVILLLDWDRTGDRLHHRLHEGLVGRCRVDSELRRRFRRLSHTSSLEEVPAEIASLRRRLGSRP